MWILDYKYESNNLTCTTAKNSFSHQNFGYIWITKTAIYFSYSMGKVWKDKKFIGAFKTYKQDSIYHIYLPTSNYDLIKQHSMQKHTLLWHLKDYFLESKIFQTFWLETDKYENFEFIITKMREMGYSIDDGV